MEMENRIQPLMDEWDKAQRRPAAQRTDDELQVELALMCHGST